MLLMLAAKKGRKNKKSTCDILFLMAMLHKINYSLDKKNNTNKKGYTFSMWEIHIYDINIYYICCYS